MTDNKKHLRMITQEDRDLIAVTKAAKKQYAEDNLKLDYADMPYWESLSTQYGTRLPSYYYPSSETKYMKRICKVTNTNIDGFIETTGFNTLKEFTQANSKWTSRALCGVLLEYINEGAQVPS